jgi:hypothetical protein
LDDEEIIETCISENISESSMKKEEGATFDNLKL